MVCRKLLAFSSGGGRTSRRKSAGPGKPRLRLPIFWATLVALLDAGHFRSPQVAASVDSSRAKEASASPALSQDALQASTSYLPFGRKRQVAGSGVMASLPAQPFPHTPGAEGLVMMDRRVGMVTL